MAKSKGGLGRGLGALLPDFDEPAVQEDEQHKIVELALERVMPNPDQPRKHFDEDQMTDLVESIREHGVLQPIIVAPKGEDYLIVAGERRWRAANRVGLTTIPAIVKELTDDQIFELALIENIQRADLNPIEEARGYKQLADRFGYSADLIAKRMGKSRPQVSNTMRLLSLPEEVLAFVEEEKLSVSHVRPLLALNDAKWPIEFAHEIYQSNLSVRDVENMINKLKKKGTITTVTKEVLFEEPPTLSPELTTIQEQLKTRLGTQVRIKNNGKKGKIEIEFYGKEDLQRVLDALGGEFY